MNFLPQLYTYIDGYAKWAVSKIERNKYQIHSNFCLLFSTRIYSNTRDTSHDFGLANL